METPNEKKAREIAKCCSVMPPTPITQEDVNAMTTNAAMQAMQWKDRERKEMWRITRNHYQEWAEEQIAQEKQQLIDKAAEWLRMTMDFFNNGEFNTEKFVNDFKQTMKGE